MRAIALGPSTWSLIGCLVLGCGEEKFGVKDGDELVVEPAEDGLLFKPKLARKWR